VRWMSFRDVQRCLDMIDICVGMRLLHTIEETCLSVPNSVLEMLDTPRYTCAFMMTGKQ
jgi:hypothetical protein